MNKPWIGWFLALLFLIIILWFLQKWEDYKKRKRFLQGESHRLEPCPVPEQARRQAPLPLFPPAAPSLESAENKVEAPAENKVCSKISKGQLRACQVLQKRLGVELKWNDRSNSWNKNPLTGRNLELDCWDPKSKIALEFQGHQHTRYPNAFHKTEEEFKDLIRKDLQKKANCKAHGVYLIEVHEGTKEEDVERDVNAHVDYWLNFQNEQRICNAGGP